MSAAIVGWAFRAGNGPMDMDPGTRSGFVRPAQWASSWGMDEETAVPLPSEALERLMAVLVWGWMNGDRPDASLEDVARRAIAAVTGYIDEHCPEWYGRQWLRREELAALSQSMHASLDDGTTPPPEDVASVTWLDGMSAQAKLLRALSAEG
jgi:hypothetical protein